MLDGWSQPACQPHHTTSFTHHTSQRSHTTPHRTGHTSHQQSRHAGQRNHPHHKAPMKHHPVLRRLGTRPCAHRLLDVDHVQDAAGSHKVVQQVVVCEPRDPPVVAAVLRGWGRETVCLLMRVGRDRKRGSRGSGLGATGHVRRSAGGTGRKCLH